MTRGMRSVFVVVAAGALAVGLTGCSAKKPLATTAPEAGAPVVPSQPPAPPGYRADVIARVRQAFPTLVRFDDGLVVDTGVYLHRVEGATVTRYGDPAAYVSLLDDSPDVTGYDAVSPGRSRTELRGTAAAPRVVVRRGEDAATKELVWSGKAFVLGAPSDESSKPVRYYVLQGEKPPNVAPDIVWRQRKKLGLGRESWLGRAQDDVEVVAFVDEKGKTALTHPLQALDPNAPRGTTGSCSLLPSADGHTYVSCSIFVDSRLGLLRLDGERWTVLFPNLPEPARANAIAVDAEGGIWRAENAPFRFVRLTPDGKETTLDLARDKLPRLDGYRTGTTATQRKASDYATVRRFVTARVETDDRPEDVYGSQYAEPMPDGSVYAVLSSSSSALLVRLARTATAPPAVAIGSPADQTIAARGTQPLRSWSGHCPQVFVRLPRDFAPDAGPSDAAFKAVAARFAKLEASRRPQVALVQGTLGDAKVAGLVFLQADPLVHQDDLEAAVNVAATLLTTNPASPPTTTCTLPVIDRVLASTAVQDVYDGD